MRPVLATFALAAALAALTVPSRGTQPEAPLLTGPGFAAPSAQEAPVSHRPADAPDTGSTVAMAAAGLLVGLMLAVRRRG